MKDLVVYITNSSAEISVDHNVLRIQTDDGKPTSIPLGMIGQLVIYANLKLETKVMAEIIHRDISIMFFSGFGKNRMPVYLSSGLSSSVMVRLTQHQAYSDSIIRLETAKWLISGKLKYQTTLIENIGILISDESPQQLVNTQLDDHDIELVSQKAIETIKSALECVQTCETVESIQAYEGVSAAAWFTFLSKILPTYWKFSGRNRRPPKDPVNAIMSLTYTLTLNELKTIIQERGLDPCIGFLHTPLSGRDSFLLDMLERLRPGADAFLIQLLHDNMIQPDDFTLHKDHGCRLNKDGRGKYFASWADWQTSWPEWQDMTPASNDNELFIDEDSNSLRTCCRKMCNEIVTLWNRQLENETPF
jgi:CRISPR-associated protein Cas1